MSKNITQRYLALLKSTLLNEVYIENEVRLLYIAAMHGTGQAVDFDVVRNISEKAPDLVRQIQEARTEGRPWWMMNYALNGEAKSLNLRNSCEFSHSMIGRQRLDNIEHCLDGIRTDNIPGDVIETGVWRGGASIFMRGYLAAYDMQQRKVWVADSFEGLPKPSLPQDAGYDFSAEKMPILAISLEEVKENFRRYDLLDEQVVFLKGWFKDTLPNASIENIALARLDGDLYESTLDALNSLYHKIVPGGYIIIDDYGDFEPCRRAVDEYRSRFDIKDEMHVIDWTGIYWRKS